MTKLTPAKAILMALKEMRASGSWDVPTLNRAVEIAETIIAQASGPPRPTAPLDHTPIA